MDQNQIADLESPEVFNRELLEAIANAQDGQLKRASESSSRMVRRRIRENGFGRLILPFKPVTDADLNQLPNTELPVIIEEMEPLSPGAKAINFNDTADTAFYRGDKFVVYFCKITTPEYPCPRVRPNLSRVTNLNARQEMPQHPEFSALNVSRISV